jgi:hypothetical protein|tara:strand:+ start:607 stop:1458 length:852 start_codon:yes stop_codon:yes gene_type:complete
MAKSGSYDWNLTVAQIVSASHRKLGVLAEGQTLSAEKMQNGIQAVNGRIKMFPALMKKLWGMDRVVQSIQTPTIWVDDTDATKNWEVIRNHTTVAANRPSSGADYLAYHKETSTTGSSWSTAQSAVSKNQYTVDNDIVFLENVKLIKADQESNLNSISREEYLNRSRKNSKGEPSQYYFEKKNSETNSFIYLFPYPDNTNYVFEYDAVRYPQDFDAQTDNPDFPPEWIPVLIYGTAIDLFSEYPAVSTKAYKVCSELYRESLDSALSLDNESGDIIVTPKLKE